MARTGVQRQVYADLLERYGRAVADAFFKAVDDLRSGAEIQRVITAYQNGDVEGALEALHIDPEVYNEMLDRIREANAEAGKKAAEGMPKRKPDGTALTVRFDGRNPEAEAWLAQHSSALITRLTEEQRQVVRTSLSEAMRAGVNPRQAALDIVGRINRVTGKREGGVLGLSVPQEGFVRTARAELASDDPAALRHYLTRTRRDKRFDRSVAKAIREEKALPPEIAAKAVVAYERRLLKLRGDMIGIHEAFAAIGDGKERAYLQAVASGKVAESAVTKAWKHLHNRPARNQHLAIDGQRVGLRQFFVLPDGTMMRYPHDPNAPISQTAGCHCQADYRIDFLANIR